MQLPLKLSLRDEAIFSNFIVGDNAQTIATLKKWIEKRHEPFLFCYGEKGSGKTHVLQACCHAFSEKEITVFYFSLTHFHLLSPAIFESLEKKSVVCIDDVDAIIEKRDWEEALFHFYNRAKERGTALLMSASKSPQQLIYALKDLKSRLSSGLTLEIKALTDAEKIDALKMRAQLRGFTLSDDVMHYLMHHYSRSMHDLFAALEKLDQASLVEKKRLTIPFVKRIMTTV